MKKTNSRPKTHTKGAANKRAAVATSAEDCESRAASGICRNTTERQQAANDLAESERRLALVLEGSELGYWDWRIDTGEVRRNARWAEMLGYTLSEIELSVKQWTDLHHPDDKEAAWKSILDHLEGRTQAHHIEYRMRCKNGEYKWILDHAKVVQRDDCGRPLRMSGTHTDITERKRAEAALHISEEKYRVLFESFPLGITISDAEGRILEGNPESERLLGLSRPEHTRRQIDGREWQTVRPDGTPMPASEYASVRALREQRVVENLEAGIVKGPNDITWLHVIAAPIPLPGYGVAVTYSNITERRRAEDALREMRERLYHQDRVARMGEMASALAHELTQPLAGILSNAQAAQLLLAGKKPDLRELADILRDIVEDDKRAGAIIQRLRTFLHKGEAKRVPVVINSLIVNLIRLIAPEMALSELELTTELGEDLPTVHADSVQIQQVIVNLVHNAQQAMAGKPPAQRRVVLATGRTTTGDVVVTVRDKGIGIPECNLSRVFDPYFTTRPEGLGMGLAICRSIVESHGGQIWAENNAEGGASVSFTLARGGVNESAVVG